MTSVAFPFDAGAGANSQEAQWMQMARYWRLTGVIPNTGLSSTAGSLNDPQVLASELSVFADSSGMQVKLHYGRAWIQGVYYDLPSADEGLPLAIAGNSSGNPRIDRVVLRLDWTANTVTPTVITGATAASPTAPALVQTFASSWDLPLAQVRVASGLATVASNLVDDERQWPGAVPTGSYQAMAVAATVRGWLLCDGSAVSRITYADLFALLGTTYGGSGTTFNLPDLRGRMLPGLDNMGTAAGAAGRIAGSTALGTANAGGAASVTLTTTQLPAHTHAVGTLAVGVSGGESATHTHGVGSLAVGTSGGTSVNHTHPIAGVTVGVNSDPHTHTVDPASTASSGGTSHVHGSVVTAVGQNTVSVQQGGASLVTVLQSVSVTTGSSGAETAHTHTTDIVSTTTSSESTVHNHALSGSTASNNLDHTHTAGAVSGVTAADATDHTHAAGAISGATASAGTGSAFSILPPYLSVAWFIKT